MATDFQPGYQNLEVPGRDKTHQENVLATVGDEARLRQGPASTWGVHITSLRALLFLPNNSAKLW